MNTNPARTLPGRTVMSVVVPTRSIALLMFVGFADLAMTAILHARGLIVELNPVMRVLIDRSEWLFVAVKGGFLVFAWAVMASYAKKDRRFVRNACLIGSAVYVTIWLSWVVGANV